MKPIFAWIGAICASALFSFHMGASSVETTKTVLTIPPADAESSWVVPLPDHMTTGQSHLLAIAYQTAKDDGFRQPQLLQGIILQESDAGELPGYKVGDQSSPPNRRSYGLGQIKLQTAKAVLTRYPDLWTKYQFQTHTDEEIIAKLIENNGFNIAVASKYCLMLNGYGYHSAKAIAVAYNKGPGGASGVDLAVDPYAAGVSRHMRALPAVAGLYHVDTGDYLTAIAVKLGISASDLFAANPGAFVGGDPNVLMAGVDLKIPGDDHGRRTAG